MYLHVSLCVVVAEARTTCVQMISWTGRQNIMYSFWVKNYKSKVKIMRKAAHLCIWNMKNFTRAALS